MCPSTKICMNLRRPLLVGLFLKPKLINSSCIWILNEFLKNMFIKLLIKIFFSVPALGDHVNVQRPFSRAADDRMTRTPDDRMTQSYTLDRSTSRHR